MASSSIRIKKVCEWCREVFYAQKTTTRYCSHRCNSRGYKETARNKRIQKTETETEVLISQQPTQIIKDKEFLSFAEAATLLGITRQAVYKMVALGYLKASKISSRLSFIKRSDIESMDAKLVITSFDELRKLIIEQFKNLSKQMESAKSTPPEQTPPTVDTSQIKELIRNIPQPDLSNLEQSATNTNALIKSEFQRSQEQLNELNEKLDNRQSSICSPPPQKHLHTVELKSSKVVVALVSLGVALLGSMSYNIYQFTANGRLSDNDIKFLYIKAFGEFTPENLLKLETIFEYEPDKQKQRSIRQMVEEHEQRVEQRARDLEQARLKEAQAEQLRQEAERIKQKK